MKITIPPNLKGKELFAYLKANKSEIIKSKRDFLKFSDNNDYPVSILKSIKKASIKGITLDTEDEETGILPVKFIGNTANWCDSQMDVLLVDSWKKTIKDSGPTGADRIYHLKNHQQSTDGIIGKISSIYSQDFTFKDLGIKGNGSTQCLVIESNVKQAYDEKCFLLYSDNEINQHSIGLQYVNIVLCVGDKDYASAQEFENWNKYYQLIINKDAVDEYQYFWAIIEIKLKEVSAVLFGSNEITYMISDDENESKKDNEPPLSTQKQEPAKTTLKANVLEMIQKTNFITIN